MDFPKPRSQYLSDETHITLRFVAGFITVLAILVLSLKYYNEDTAIQAAAPTIETCVTHPVTKKVMVQ